MPANRHEISLVRRDLLDQMCIILRHLEVTPFPPTTTRLLHARCRIYSHRLPMPVSGSRPSDVMSNPRTGVRCARDSRVTIAMLVTDDSPTVRVQWTYQWPRKIAPRRARVGVFFDWERTLNWDAMRASTM